MIRAWRRVADQRRQAGGRYGWLFNPYTGDELIAIGCEATGRDPRTAEPVAIAAVRVRDDRVLTSESLSLRLQAPASPGGDATRLHGRAVDLEGGLGVDEALARLLDFVGNRPLLGWGLDVDIAIINRQLRSRLGFDLPNAQLDIAQRYARELRRRHPELESRPRFEATAEALGVPMMGRHTALGDAVTAALMYLRLERGAIRSV